MTRDRIASAYATWDRMCDLSTDGMSPADPESPLAAARAEGARDMRTKIERLADDRSLWAQHRPVVGKFAGMFAAVGCSCMDRVFVAGAESYAQHIAALLADGGEPQ